MKSFSVSFGGAVFLFAALVLYDYLKSGSCRWGENLALTLLIVLFSEIFRYLGTNAKKAEKTGDGF